MTVASDNPYPSVLFAEHVDPATPGSGTARLFVDSADGLLKLIDDAAAVTTYAAAGAGAVATDAIWDAAGDLAVGSGANTAARLALGAAGGALSRVNGAVAWNSGTTFPTAAAGDRYWRTDLGMEFYYDGTRWLSTTLHHFVVAQQNISATATYAAPSGSLTPLYRLGVPSLSGGSDIWLVSLNTDFFVNAGTALSGSHKWVVLFQKIVAADTPTTVLTVTIDSGSSSVWRRDTQAIGALLNNGTLHYNVWSQPTKTGTPGPLFMLHDLTYRIVAT